MAESNLKQVVSMLVGESKITLFTIAGEVLDLKEDGPYDTAKLTEFLSPQLTGTKAVEVDLSEYLTVARALGTPDYEEEGIIVTQIIDGKEVQGIFYPEKVKVTVAVKDEATGTSEPVEVPEIENLERHMNRASKEQSPAVRNFLKRLAPVLKDRLHSAEDLMRFLGKSDLPFTNDGRIIGYKRVKTKHNGQAGVYVDCHTGNVQQKVGTRVWMEVDAVDPDRNRSCSHGLHVANLGYLGGFHGSHTLVVLVNPEDFIAVPHGETTKCRVSSYEIIGVLSGASQKVVNGGSHIEGDPVLKNLLKAAVEGRLPGPVESVKVSPRNGQVLERMQITQELQTKAESLKPTPVPESSGESLNVDEQIRKGDASKNLSTARQATGQSVGNKPWDSADKVVLSAFADMIDGVMSKAAIARKHGTSSRSLDRWMVKYDFEGYKAFKDNPPKAEKTATNSPEPTPTTVDTANMTLKELAAHLFKLWQESSSVESEALTFQNLLVFKQARKKGWLNLGFSEAEKDLIEARIKRG